MTGITVYLPEERVGDVAWTPSSSTSSAIRTKHRKVSESLPSLPLTPPRSTVLHSTLLRSVAPFAGLLHNTTFPTLSPADRLSPLHHSLPHSLPLSHFLLLALSFVREADEGVGALVSATHV